MSFVHILRLVMVGRGGWLCGLCGSLISTLTTPVCISVWNPGVISSRNQLAISLNEIILEVGNVCILPEITLWVSTFQ